MIWFESSRRRLGERLERRRVEGALALHLRGEARTDGLSFIRSCHHLEIEWRARGIHPWDRDRDAVDQQLLFIEQSLADTDAAVSRLFLALPEIDTIEFRAMHPDSDQQILAGTVERSAPAPVVKGASARTRLWHKGLTVMVLAVGYFAGFARTASAQSQTTTTAAASSEIVEPSTSTDLFVMLGSDFDRSGSLPRANYNIGIGHTYGFLKKNPFGDQLTFSYTYENAGTHGWWYTGYGEHTETLGVMKNFGIPKTKAITGYTWLDSGITSYTGYAHVLNRMATGVSLGAVVHFSFHNSCWIQESYNKVVTVPWYLTTSVGYTYSW